LLQKVTPKPDPDTKSDPNNKREYQVAMSNRLFQDSEMGLDLPCMHCKRIEMGEIACYQDVCPECGKTEPRLKRDQEKFLRAQANYRKLMVLHKAQKNGENLKVNSSCFKSSCQE